MREVSAGLEPTVAPRRLEAELVRVKLRGWAFEHHLGFFPTEIVGIHLGDLTRAQLEVARALRPELHARAREALLHENVRDHRLGRIFGEGPRLRHGVVTDRDLGDVTDGIHARHVGLEIVQLGLDEPLVDELRRPDDLRRHVGRHTDES